MNILGSNMVTMDLSFCNTSLPSIEEKKNHEKSENYPILKKISVFIYIWMNFIMY